MKFFDLFAGVGGFRLGMERNGHECIGSCEIDKYARETYKKNFGNYPEFSDARLIKAQDLQDFDVLTAGFPCQAWSLAGFRKGFEDSRGDLFFQIVRLAREKQPQILFLENVKGLLSHDKGASFREMLSTLDEVGYDIQWQVINSKYFVPQNRERIFIIGYLRGTGRRKILPLGFNRGKDSEREPELKQVGNIDTKGHNSIWGRVYDTSGIAVNINANGGGMGAKTGLYVDKLWKEYNNEKNVDNKIKVLGNKNPSGKGQSGIIYDSNGLSPTLQAGTGEHQNSQGYIAVVKDHDKLRKLKDDKSTMVGANYFKGADNHGQRTLIQKGMRVRRLTPLECERLQGFPDNWTKGLSDTQRYKQIGNAVTVDVIEYIARGF
jgi:DNA (cytosine-5)-methyltransferase 1